MIDRKHEPVVFAFFMALLMSCFMSLVISILNVGMVDDIASIWLKAWGVAFAVAFPAILVVAPVVKRLVDMVLKYDEKNN